MKDFINSIKPDTTLYDKFHDRVITECNISRQTWYNWTAGKPIEAKYKPIIDRIAIELYGKAVFTEES